jgi:hypothetical protein
VSRVHFFAVWVEIGARGEGRQREAEEQEQEWNFAAAWHGASDGLPGEQ